MRYSQDRPPQAPALPYSLQDQGPSLDDVPSRRLSVTLASLARRCYLPAAKQLNRQTRASEQAEGVRATLATRCEKRTLDS